MPLTLQISMPSKACANVVDALCQTLVRVIPLAVMVGPADEIACAHEFKFRFMYINQSI